MQMLEVGKKWSGPMLHQEGAVLELGENGFGCMIQMPNITENEVEGFKKSFRRYAYLETSTEVPIAIWVFDFPFSPIDVNFNAKVVQQRYPGRLEKYLSLTPLPNALMFYLLDGEILKGIKMVRFEPKSIELFQATIKKQIAMDYTFPEFSETLNSMYRYTTIQLMNMGVQFKHQEKSKYGTR